MAVKLRRYRLTTSELTTAQERFLQQRQDSWATMTSDNNTIVLWIDPEPYTENQHLLIDILFGDQM